MRIISEKHGYRVYVNKKIGMRLLEAFGNDDYILVPYRLFEKMCNIIRQVASEYCSEKNIEKCVRFYDICRELDKLRSIYS